MDRKKAQRGEKSDVSQIQSITTIQGELLVSSKHLMGLGHGQIQDPGTGEE